MQSLVSSSLDLQVNTVSSKIHTEIRHFVYSLVGLKSVTVILFVGIYRHTNPIWVYVHTYM